MYINKASPWENDCVESFSGRLRDELLNRELFLGLDEARYVLDEWRNDYSHRRLHSGIGWQTPVAYVATCDDTTVGACPTAMLADPAVGATPLPPAQLGNLPQSILSH